VDRDVVASFREAVYYYHNGVKATRSEDGANKVDRDMFPALCREGEGFESALVLQPRGGVSVTAMAVSSKPSAVVA
jgi:hypothetical protein